MRPVTLALSMEAVDRNGISVAQTPTEAGNLTITGAYASGGVATLDVPRHISIYSDGDESGDTYTITGTDRFGIALTEDITGPNTTTVKGSRNFATVTQVAVDGAGTGNIEVGTADELESKVIGCDFYCPKISYSITLSSGADLTYTFEYTLDDLQDSSYTEYGANFFEDLGAQIANSSSSSDAPITGCRVKITGFTSGTATLRLIHGE